MSKLIELLRETATGADHLFSNTSNELLRSSADALEAQEAQIKALEAALRPSAETKAAYIGEFSFTVSATEVDENGDPYECQNTVTVPWTTTKEIMAAVRDFALTLSKEGQRE